MLSVRIIILLICVLWPEPNTNATLVEITVTLIMIMRRILRRKAVLIDVIYGLAYIGRVCDDLQSLYPHF